MSMARTPHKPAPILPDPSTVADAHAITLAADQQTQDIEREMIFTAGKIASRIETALFYETVSQKVAVESYLELKKTKAFRALTYRDADGKAKHVSSLEEFCQVFLKRSQRRVQQLADNYHTIGADLYETAEQIGFGQRDYSALKALPADDQAIIKQAIAADDRDQVIDLLQEMAARHASEKAALQAETTEAKETAEARDQVVRKKEQRLNELEEENHKLKRRVQTTTPDEEALEVRNEADRIAFEAEHAVSANLRKAFDHLAEFGGQHSEFMLGLITQIELACDVLRADFGLLKAGPDGDSTPIWERAGAGQG